MQPPALADVTTDTAPPNEAEVAARRAARLAEHLRLVTDALPALTQRKEVEATLRASEQRLRFMAEAMPQKVFTARANGEVDYFNPQWTEFTGLSFEQIRDWDWTRFIHPDDLEESLRLWQHSLATGEPFYVEHRFRRADGEYRWHLSRAMPLRDEAGQIIMWTGSNTDIHEIKQGENRHRFLVDLTTATQPLVDPDQIMLVTARMLGQHLNADRCAYAEIEPDEDQFVVTGDYVRGVASVVGRWSLSAFGGALQFLRAGKTHVVDDVERNAGTAATLEAYRNTQVQASIAVPLHKDGRLRAAMAVHQKTPRQWLPEEIELVEQVVHRCWDAIERARAVRRLRESEARKSAVVNSSLDGIISMDHEGRIVEWNPAAERIFGYRRAQAVGRPMDQIIIPPALRARHRQGLAHYLKTGEGPVLGRRIEVPALRSDGSQFPAELSITRIPDTDPPQFTGMIRDITERKRAEQALKDNDRRKDEFLATLAHELRNPLAPIRNSLGLLRMAGGSQPIHEIMERQVNHMVRLVDDLLEISRISRGKIELRRERLELSAVIHSALETAHPLMEAGGHRFHVSLPPEPLALDADPVRLTQVFANLLNNAAKYTPPGGRIELEVVREGGQAVVSVHDNGAGIPETMLPRVFEMFTQVDRTLNRAQGGLGIGLSLARNLVEMHGGRITARSGGPGKGSEFIVRLPLADSPANEAGAAVETKPPPAQVRSPHAILVVDDNPDAADSLGMLLKFLGAEVRVEHSGPAALEALKSFKPSVVLLDLGMPGMDGLEVACRMRQLEGPGLTLIALTGWGQEKDRRRTREAGFDHHLVKPSDVTALRALLASLEQPRKGAAPA